MTEQEEFWKGAFGDEYVARNSGEAMVASNLALFSRIGRSLASAPGSCIEYGANRGLNLRALKALYPRAELSAVEINSKAAQTLRNDLSGVEVHEESLLSFSPARRFELVLIKGVLIHIDPAELPRVYQLLYDSSSRYILLAEYYNPTPVQVSYRGHANKLFKRDFAGEFLERHQDCALRDYGFAYHGDTSFPQDDITWFLIEKTPE